MRDGSRQGGLQGEILDGSDQLKHYHGVLLQLIAARSTEQGVVVVMESDVFRLDAYLHEGQQDRERR